MADLPKTVQDVETPCFLVDVDKVKRNAKRMRDMCDSLGIELRAHMKTHKTLEAGDILTAGSKRCVEVSTMREVEFYAEAGYDDILFGYPITSDKIQRCQKLANSLEAFKVFTDSQHGVDALKSAQLNPGKKWCVFLEIDMGMGRTGVKWDTEDVIKLAKQLYEAENIEFLGLYVHTGDSYKLKGKEQLEDYGKTLTDKYLSLKQKLVDNGIPCRSLVSGSTPSCSKPHEAMSAIDVFTPGNYVFFDAMQYKIGSCTEEDIACRVATRVIGHKPELNQLSIDCGFLGLSLDGFSLNLPTGPCLFQNNPNLKLLRMSQEIGQVVTVEGEMDFSKYPVGSMLFMYPFHSCNTAAHYPEYFVHSGENIVGIWRPCRGW